MHIPGHPTTPKGHSLGVGGGVHPGVQKEDLRTDLLLVPSEHTPILRGPGTPPEGVPEPLGPGWRGWVDPGDAPRGRRLHLPTSPGTTYMVAMEVCTHPTHPGYVWVYAPVPAMPSSLTPPHLSPVLLRSTW